MTDLFGNYQSQSTRQLTRIDSSKYPDTNEDFEANMRRLNSFVDYISQYLQQMQKGVDQAAQDPISRLRDTITNLGILFGGGELLYGIDLGDLQYILPALGALFGFDSDTPFPLNLLEAAEHFLLGYIIPLDSWNVAVEGIIDGWMVALGLNQDFIDAVHLLLDNMARFTGDLMALFKDVTGLLGVFNIFDFVNGPIGPIWSELSSLLSNFNIANLGAIADPFLETLTPWIHALAVILGKVDDFIEGISGGLGGGSGILDNPLNWLTDLLGVFGLSPASGLGTGSAIIPGLNNIPLIGPIASAIFGGLSGGTISTDWLGDLTDILQNINFLNILGVGGPGDIGSSVQAIISQFVGGAIGFPVTGASLTDMFNVSNIISSWSRLGQMGWDILGIRSNTPLSSGFLRTSQSNIALDKIFITPSALSVTDGDALSSYHIIKKSIDIGVIAFQGWKTGTVDNFYINLYKMDEATGQNGPAIHSSLDVASILQTSEAHTLYNMPSTVHFDPGDILVVEKDMRGSGTVHVQGGVSSLVSQAVFPRKWASRRNPGGTTPPATTWTPSYSDDVAVVEVGITGSLVPLPHGDEKVSHTSNNTVPIPDWCNFVDRAVLGSPGGGHGGGTWGVGGAGGHTASWSADMLERGIDFTTGDVLTSTVPSGGNGGGFLGNGSNGSASSSSIAGGSILSSSGGTGATTYDIVGSDHQGRSPGDFVWPGSGAPWTILGGVAQNTYGADGNPDGGAGAGGNWITFQPGGDGADGVVWYRFRQ